jgi:spermidine/putrescine transport system permease protein
MVSATAQASANGVASDSIGRRISRFFHRSETARSYALLSPNLWMLLCLLVAPFAGLAILSFWTQDNYDFDRTATLANYAKIFELGWPENGVEFFGYRIGWPFANPIYTVLLAKSVAVSVFVTIVVILFAYPMAYFLAFRVQRHKMMWLILISIPFWTSYLLRIFAWKVILGFNGVINSTLIYLGFITEPLDYILYNTTSVVITLTHAWVTFAVLPIYVSLEKMDKSLLEAATDLGDTAIERFFRVTLPLSAPGTIAAALLVFIPTVGEYVTPNVVGGTSGILVGNHIQSLFGKSNDWPMGAALSNVMMLTVALLVCVFLWAVGYQRMRQRTA